MTMQKAAFMKDIDRMELKEIPIPEIRPGRLWTVREVG